MSLSLHIYLYPIYEFRSLVELCNLDVDYDFFLLIGYVFYFAQIIQAFFLLSMNGYVDYKIYLKIAAGAKSLVDENN